MIKYNEQCLSIHEADDIGKPNKINGIMTVGAISALLAPVEVIIKPLTANIPEKRIVTASDGSGIVSATIAASMLEWFRPNETYLVMIAELGTNTLYNFITHIGGPSGNAARVRTTWTCEAGDFSLLTREGAECTNC